MRWIRPRLAPVAAAWLVFQLALFISVPTTLCATTSANGVGAECTCDHGDGQMCPMHHTRTKSHTEHGSRSCSCRSSLDPLAALAAALSGPPGVLSARANAVAPQAPSTPEPIVPVAPAAWIAVPDSPPPRA